MFLQVGCTTQFFCGFRLFHCLPPLHVKPAARPFVRSLSASKAECFCGCWKAAEWTEAGSSSSEEATCNESVESVFSFLVSPGSTLLLPALPQVAVHAWARIVIKYWRLESFWRADNLSACAAWLGSIGHSLCWEAEYCSLLFVWLYC